MTIYQETIQLFQINSFQERTYNTDKYWLHFNDFYRANELRVQGQELQRGNQKFYGREFNVSYHGWQRNIQDFKTVKMVKFGFFAIYFTHLKLLIFIHTIPRIFSRISKSVKTTYTFSHEIKLTYLTASKSEK